MDRPFKAQRRKIVVDRNAIIDDPRGDYKRGQNSRGVHPIGDQPRDYPRGQNLKESYSRMEYPRDS